MNFDPNFFKDKNGFDLEFTRLKNEGLESFKLIYYLIRKCIMTFLWAHNNVSFLQMIVIKFKCPFIINFQYHKNVI